MKKIMLALSIALTAGVMQAASLNWVVAGVTLPETTTPANGVAVYMFLTAAGGNTLSFVPTASLTTVSEVESAITGGTFTGAGAYVSSTLNSSGATTAATGVSTSFGAGDSLTAFAVIFDNADVSLATSYMIAQSATGDTELSQSWTSSTGAKVLNWGNQTTNGTTWTSMAAVPEPTSGLLMLLGMAGLALRRRRA